MGRVRFHSASNVLFLHEIKLIDLRYLAYDAITELCYGAPFGFIKEGRDIHGLIGEFHGALPYVSSLMRFAWLLKPLQWSRLGRFIMPKPGDDSGVGKIMQVGSTNARLPVSPQI